MSTWSGIRAKLENDYLAPSLRGRIQYFATSYSKCPDHEGRAAIRLDGKEILKSSYYEMRFTQDTEFHRICKEQPELNNAERYKTSFNETLKAGEFDQNEFYAAFMEFDNQGIDKSLTSENPIVRLFAILDRRVGKRRLILIKDQIGDELEWLQPFYFLRLTVEKLL